MRIPPPRIPAGRLAGLLLGLLAGLQVSAAAPYENGTADTPGKRLPVGTYECRQGSYKFQPCEVSQEEGRFYLTVTAGGRLQFKAELWPTDEKGQLLLRGTLSNPGELCPTCADDAVGTECAGSVQEKTDCAAQPVMASIRQKGKQWSGDLMYYLVRAVDGQPAKGWYRLGITDKFTLRPAKAAAGRK